MLDELLEALERDKKSSTSKGGLRGKLASLIGGTDYDARKDEDRSRTSDTREGYTSYDRDDDDYKGKKKREREFFEFGDD